MSLLKKILTFTFIFIFIWIGIMVYLMENIVMKGYTSLEEKNIEREITILNTSIEVFLTRLDPILNDWSKWDDAYNFVDNPNQEFIDSNMTKTLFEDLEINYILIADFKDHILYQQGFNRETNEFIEVPDVFVNESVRHLNNAGFIYHDGKPLIFTSKLIVDSNNIKSPNGIISFGYYLDPEFISKIANSIGIDLNINSYNSNTKPIQSDNIIINKNKNVSIIRDYIPYVNENSYLVLETLYHNEISYLGRKITNNAIIFFIFLFVSLTLLMYLGLRTIVNRILKLNSDVNKISRNKNFKLRLNLEGDDELTTLKDNINLMLDKIESMNTQLIKYATLDVMTGILNRRAGIEKLENLMEKSKIQNSNLSIAFIDVNHLKLINDQFGHNLGDQLIIQVSSIIQNSLRKTDIFCRLGGDEFLIIFPNLLESDVQKVIARINDDMDAINKKNTNKYQLSISCGIQEYDKKMDTEEFIESADIKMYEDKTRQKK